MDFNTLKTLYEEILQTQAVSEKQLQELRELIDSLNSLRSDYANVDNNLTENAKLLATILQKANIVYENIEHFETQTNKNLQKLQEELKSTIKSVTTQLQSDLDSILYATKSKLQKREQELEELANNYNYFASSAKKFWNEQKNITQQKLAELKEQIETQTQEIFIELEQKSLLQRGGAVIMIGFFGIVIGIMIVFFAFKQDLMFAFKYSNTCYTTKNIPYKCYVLPLNKVNKNANNNAYLIEK